MLTTCAGSPSAWAGNDPYQTLIAAHRFEAAVKLLEPSAQSGNPLSQYRLAVLLRSGLGVPRNEGRARTLLRLSASAGNPDAPPLLARLSEVVTTDTLSATPVPPQRRPQVAMLDGLPERPAGGPDGLTMVAARTFKGVTAADLRTRATVADADGQTPLITAVRAGNGNLVAALIAAGAPIEASDKRGDTALHWAARSGSQPMFSVLLGAGADAGRPDAAGDTPMEMAARHCNAGMLRAASLHTRKPRKGASSQGLAQVIAKSCPGASTLTGYIADDDLQRPDALGRTPLWYAAERGNAAMTAFLLAKGASSGAADAGGLTPLHAAAARGHDGVVAQLLASGAYPDTLDAGGNTPLMLAAAGGQAPCVAQLLARAVSPDLKNGDGETALLLAIKSGKSGAIGLLRSAGASMLARSVSRDTPAKLAARMTDPAMRDALR
jgi:uncharacterized protein